jgi:hypothetical protein
MPVTAMHGWEARMRSRTAMSKAMGQRVTIADRLIALGILLCLLLLIAVSGPHLVHHLDDLYAEHSHSDTHKSQSADCLVLSLMQHTPLLGDFFTPRQACLPITEQTSGEPQRQTVGTPRSTVHARSPPITSLS